MAQAESDNLKSGGQKILSTFSFILLMALLIIFFTNQSFFDWAFHRHHNTLSWWIRPLMIIPLIAAAYWRSWTGIWHSLIALFTSMFWFPAPQTPNPKVIEFLEMERNLLLSGWTLENILGAATIIAYGTILIWAIWHRSIKIAILTIVTGGLLKSVWSISASPTAGTIILPAAIIGTAVTILIALIYWRQMHR